MGSSVLSCLVCVLCVIVLPVVWADYCSSYTDTYSNYHETQKCSFMQFCCGSCYQRYCCSEKKYRLTDDEQERCQAGTGYGKRSKIAVLLGSILGTLLPILLCVGVVICCVAPCCLFYKKCRKGRSGRNQTAPNTTVVNSPMQPLSPSGYQPSYPGYQPVPVQPGYGGQPNPSAPPPSYMESTNPPAFNPGQPMYPFPGQPYAPPASHGQAQPPYNPSYSPNQ